MWKWGTLLLAVVQSLFVHLQAQELNESFNNWPNSELKWFGDLDAFTKVEDGLQLQADTIESPVEVFCPINRSSTKNIHIKLRTSASLSAASNYIKIYFLANGMDPKHEAFQAYYLKIGSNGSEDKVMLYRQRGASSQKLTEGAHGLFGSTGFETELRLELDKSDCQVSYRMADSLYNNALSYHSIENSESNSFFGMGIAYSSKNTSHFMCESILIDPYLPDNKGPVLQDYYVRSSTEVLLEFNEATRISQQSKFRLNDSIPLQFLHGSNAHQIIVQVPFPILERSDYRLSVKVFDWSGNMSDTNFWFRFALPQPGELVINEFLANPDDHGSDFEFIEILNVTEESFRLDDILISDRNTRIACGTGWIKPGEYCVFHGFKDGPTHGQFHYLKSFPTLNNSGEELTLYNKNFRRLDAVVYSGGQLSEKHNSLECIDPFSDCRDLGNWKEYSGDFTNSAGSINSGYSPYSDQRKPEFIQNSDSNRIVLDMNPLPFHMNHLAMTFSMDGITDLELLQYDSIRNRFYLRSETELEPNHPYSLIIKQLPLCNSKHMDTTLVGFIISYEPIKADWLDLIICEIMADPEPSRRLPAYEYVEIMNRAAEPIELATIDLVYDGKRFPLDSMLLMPDSHVALSSLNGSELLNEFGNTLYVKGFPSLRNDKAQIGLYSRSRNLVIHSMVYSADMFVDLEKSQGGTALEMIDTRFPCPYKDNWKESLDKKGGTPGRPNKLQVNYADLKKPEITFSYLENDSLLYLGFSEIIPLDNGIGIVNDGQGGFSFDCHGDTLLSNRFSCTIAPPLNSDAPFQIRIEDFKDCAGNQMDQFNIEISRSYAPDSGDLVINEILFNENAGGTAYIELFSNANRVLDLRDIGIVRFDAISGNAKPYYPFDSLDLLDPGQYLVLCEDSIALAKFHRVLFPERIMVAALPSLPNGDASLKLIRKDSTEIDWIHYESSWHHVLLNDRVGVSLEKLSPHIDGRMEASWHSASSLSGYGTPGYQNSQFNDDKTKSPNAQLSANAFSPNNDGYNDLVTIYVGNSSNVSGELSVYSLNGQFVGSITGTQIFAPQAVINWDGNLLNRMPLPDGTYLLLIDLFAPSRGRQTSKHVITLYGR